MSEKITAHEKSYLAAVVKISRLEKELAVYRDALGKVSDPRKRDHKEPDDYTEKCCLMHIANEAVALGEKIREGRE